ncbi:MAG: hypothetical protein ACRDI1_04360 [Actinomycetota bacterium]
MDALLPWLPLIGCAAMMLLVCIPMMRNMHRGDGGDGAASGREVAELREEIARLRAERTASERETTHG